MIDPVVSIVISAYRRLPYLQEALASARAQTFQAFEIIISDDGPSDEIERFVSSVDDPRVRYRRNARNLGIAMNHYIAFLEARGRYIANLDDDDLWEPTFLEELVPPLEEDPTLSVVFCDHHLIDHEGRLLPARTDDNSRLYRRTSLAPGRHQPFLEMAVVHESIPMAMGAIFRKSILEGADYPPRIGGCYDHWLAYLAARKGLAAFYVPKRLTRYRLHSKMGTATRGQHNHLNAIYVRRRFLKEAQLAPFRPSISNSLGVCYGKLALYLLERRSFHRGWIMEKRSFALMNRPKNFVGLVKNSALHLLRSLWK